jgi:hypothetical protein
MQGENMYARGSVLLWHTNGAVWCSANVPDLYLQARWLELRTDHKLIYLIYRLSHCSLYPNNFLYMEHPRWCISHTYALIYRLSVIIKHLSTGTRTRKRNYTTAVPFWSCSKAVYKPGWHIPMLSVKCINSWWWTDELSETCRVTCQNKFVKLMHLVGFIIKKVLTYLSTS